MDGYSIYSDALKKKPEHYLIDMSLMLGLAIFINGVNIIFLYAGLILVNAKNSIFFASCFLSNHFDNNNIDN